MSKTDIGPIALTSASCCILEGVGFGSWESVLVESLIDTTLQPSLQKFLSSGNKPHCNNRPRPKSASNRFNLQALLQPSEMVVDGVASFLNFMKLFQGILLNSPDGRHPTVPGL
jgi:hypothetical protein